MLGDGKAPGTLLGRLSAREGSGGLGYLRSSLRGSFMGSIREGGGQVCLTDQGTWVASANN